jgi:ribosomal-protein-alanine N-acetyltransferase
MRLTTDRLIIREYEKKDASDLIENINDLEVSKYLLVVPHPYRDKEAAWWLNQCQKNAKKKLRADYEFAIELKSEKKLVGGISLKKVDSFQGKAEIGFWLGKKYWRQGLMTETIAAMLEFAFNRLGLRRIDWCAFAENEASNALAKKMGFTFEGTLRKGVRSKADGVIHDENFYGLLKEEWLKNKQ